MGDGASANGNGRLAHESGSDVPASEADQVAGQSSALSRTASAVQTTLQWRDNVRVFAPWMFSNAVFPQFAISPLRVWSSYDSHALVACEGKCKDEAAGIRIVYVRSGTSYAKIEALVADYCAGQQALKDALEFNAKGRADRQCPEGCICSGKVVEDVCRWSQVDDARADLESEEWGQSKDDIPLDPKDPDVPKPQRVYISVEFIQRYEGVCVPKPEKKDKTK